jgi:thiamine pyrophosphate-dependent acetolactate synthase large subunit-like protein
MSSQLRVGEAVVDLLVREYGVDTVFGIPGVHNIELYRGLHRSGVRAISPRHEQGAGFMADGWSVVTGRPGVCTLITGPGLTNALTPMAQAFHDSRPMLVLAATTDTGALGKRFGPLHDLDDQAAVARTVTAFSETVTDPAELPGLLARAWEVFTSSRPRPVHLAIPTDVLERWVDPFTAVPSSAARPVADDATIAAAVGALAGAGAGDRVVIAGGGAIDAGAEVLAVAEALDAAVVLTGNAKGVVASSHPRCAGNVLGSSGVQRRLEAAAAVLVVGSEVSDADLYNGGRALAFTGTTVRIDLDADQLHRRMTPTVAVHGDAAVALAAIAERLAARGGPGVTAHSAGQVLAAELHATALGEFRPDLLPWVDAIAATLVADTVVALDSTQLAYTAHVALPCERPRSWLAPYGLGTLGCALPMAIGAAVADRARPVVALAGDGGWLFTVAEMATAADEQLDLVLVLWDNRGYAQIRQSFDDVDAPRMGVDVSSTDPLGIARGFGWQATSVASPGALTVAIREAQQAGGPHLVRVEVPGAYASPK